MILIKVRVAVAVDPQGNWVSAGWKGANDDDLLDSAISGVAQGECCYWITAELEIPEIPEAKEIKAEVEIADEQI